MSKNNVSLPKTVEVCGVEIRKMPCGKYFEALEQFKELPEEFMKALFKGKTEIKLSSIMSIDGLINTLIEFLTIFPDFTFKFLAKLLDVEEDKLKNEISPFELILILKKFVEINELESFQEMKPILMNIKKMFQSKLASKNNCNMP